MRRLKLPAGPAHWEVRLLKVYRRTRDGKFLRLPRALGKELRECCDFHVTHAAQVALRRIRIRCYRRSQLDRQVDTVDDVKVFDLKPGMVAASASDWGCPSIHISCPRYGVVFKPYEYITIHLNCLDKPGRLTERLPIYITNALNDVIGRVLTAAGERTVARWRLTLHILKPFRVRFERVNQYQLRMHLTAQYAMSAVGKEIQPEVEED